MVKGPPAVELVKGVVHDNLPKQVGLRKALDLRSKLAGAGIAILLGRLYRLRENAADLRSETNSSRDQKLMSPFKDQEN